MLTLTGSTSLSYGACEEPLPIQQLDSHHGAFQTLSVPSRSVADKLTKSLFDALHCLPSRFFIPVPRNEFLPQSQAELERNVGAEFRETEARVVGVEEVEEGWVCEFEVCCLAVE